MKRPSPSSAHVLTPPVWPAPAPSIGAASQVHNSAALDANATPSWPTPVSSRSKSPALAVTQEAVAKARERRIIQSVHEATVLAIQRHMKREDLRSKGGAFWIQDDGKDQDVRKQLIQLGFGFLKGRGYWIK